MAFLKEEKKIDPSFVHEPALVFVQFIVFAEFTVWYCFVCWSILLKNKIALFAIYANHRFYIDLYELTTCTFFNFVAFYHTLVYPDLQEDVISPCELFVQIFEQKFSLEPACVMHVVQYGHFALPYIFCDYI